MDAFVTTEIKTSNQAQCVVSGTYFLNFRRKDMKDCGYRNGDDVFVIIEGDTPCIKLYNMKNHKDHKKYGSTHIANNEDKNDIFIMTKLDSQLYYIMPDMVGLPLIRRENAFKDVPILIGNLATNIHQGPPDHGTKLKVKINFPYIGE